MEQLYGFNFGWKWLLAPRICGPFEVINSTSKFGVSLSAVDIKMKCPPTLQLYQEMAKFDRVKSVQCTSCHSPISKGLPLVYKSGTDNDSVNVIGVTTRNGRALILSSLFQLLKGINKLVTQQSM